MKPPRIAFALLVLLCAVALPATAKERAFSQYAESGSDKDRAAARTKIVSKAVKQVLLDDGLLKAISGEKRVALIKDCESLLSDERFRKRRGRWRLTAKLDLDKVRAKAIAAKSGRAGGDPKASAKKLRFVVEFELPGQKGERAELLEEIARGDLATVLEKRGHMLVNGTAKTAGKGVLVIKVKLRVRFEAAKGPAARMYQGRHRIRASIIEVHDPATDTTRARATLRSDRNRVRFEESNSTALAEIIVRKGESLEEAEEHYYEHVASWVGRIVCKKLNAEGPLAKKPARRKRNRASADDEKEPTGERQVFRVTLKGFSEEELDDTLEELQSRKGVKGWQEKAKTGMFCVLEFSYPGSARSMIRKTLKALGIGASVRLTGRTVTASRDGTARTKGTERKKAKKKKRDEAEPQGLERVSYMLRLKGFSEDELEQILEELQDRKGVKEWQEKGKFGVFCIVKFSYPGSARSMISKTLRELRIDAKVSLTGRNINAVRR
ncbi:MAG: hypothetical protein JKY65_18900 [Planctomycetes bacterium]|nr:hypothetical protein [Planctomycetota bacterium]